MKKFLCCFSLLLFAAVTMAQQPPAADFAATFKAQYTSNKGFILASVAKWPADQFGWRPAGLEAELRTFGQTMAHIANENNMVCSRILGQPLPPHLDDAKGVFSQAEATKFLKDAFALCDPVYNSLTNQSMTEMMKVQGRGGTTERPRGTTLVANVAHSNEQYGMIMIYFGMKNMTPPSHAK